MGNAVVGYACRGQGPRGAIEEGFDIRESIYKFSHSKSRQKFQNLDLGPDYTAEALHHTRRVFVGGKRPEES